MRLRRNLVSEVALSYITLPLSSNLLIGSYLLFPPKSHSPLLACSNRRPASSPWVTAVGATMGPESGEHTNLVETVCSAASGSAITSGGGFSIIYGRPSWQTSAVSTYLTNTGQTFTGNSYVYLASTTATRGLPDVSLMGNKYIVVIGGKQYALSGTSASSPALAGFISLANSQRFLSGKGSLGFLNPTLYAGAASIYNDIVSGNINNYYDSPTKGGAGITTCAALGFAAATGWDPATGLGTPKFAAWSAYLAGALPCAAGSASLSGAAPCTPCAAGTYASLPAATSCQQVPAGYYSAMPGGLACSGGCSSYAPCSTGYYNPSSGQTACTQQVPAGSFATSKQNSGVPSASGAAGFTACPAGSCSPNPGSTYCSSCSTGFYSSAGQTACTEVLPGSYASSGATQSTVCPAGSFSKNAGTTSCTPCAAGYYTSLTGQQSCSEVPAGYFATTLSESNMAATSGATGFTKCTGGYYSSSSGATKCTPCAAGYFAPYEDFGVLACTVVPTGSYASTYQGSNEASRSGAKGYSSCPVGTFAHEAGMTACSPCDPGYYYYTPSTGAAFCSPFAPPSPAPSREPTYSPPTYPPTLAPTTGAITLSATLIFSGLTQAVISGDSAGSIASALQFSIAHALEITSQLATAKATIGQPHWSFSTTTALRIAAASAPRPRARRLDSTATATLSIQAFSTDLPQGSSGAAAVGTLLSQKGGDILLAVQQSFAVQTSTGLSVGFVGAAASVVVAPTPSPVAGSPPAAPTPGSGSSGSSNSATGTVIGTVVGVVGSCLLAAVAAFALRSRVGTINILVQASAVRGEDGQPEIKGEVTDSMRLEMEAVTAPAPANSASALTGMYLHEPETTDKMRVHMGAAAALPLARAPLAWSDIRNTWVIANHDPISEPEGEGHHPTAPMAPNPNPAPNPTQTNATGIPLTPPES